MRVWQPAVYECHVLVLRFMTGQRNLHFSYPTDICGIYNIEADSLSRQAWAEIEIEWKLNPDLLRQIQGVWRCLIMVDLFACRHNAQTSVYFSWQHDFAALGIDRLHHKWACKTTVYAYPPVFLILRLLQKVIQDEVCDLLLIAPLFHYGGTPSSSTSKWITSDPSGNATWKHTWPLAAFRISGQMDYFRSSRWKFGDTRRIQGALQSISSCFWSNRIFCKVRQRRRYI